MKTFHLVTLFEILALFHLTVIAGKPVTKTSEASKKNKTSCSLMKSDRSLCITIKVAYKETQRLCRRLNANNKKRGRKSLNEAIDTNAMLMGMERLKELYDQVNSYPSRPKNYIVNTNALAKQKVRAYENIVPSLVSKLEEITNLIKQDSDYVISKSQSKNGDLSDIFNEGGDVSNRLKKTLRQLRKKCKCKNDNNRKKHKKE